MKRSLKWLLSVGVSLAAGCLEYRNESEMIRPEIGEVPEATESEIEESQVKQERPSASLDREEEPRLYFFGVPVR